MTHLPYQDWLFDDLQLLSDPQKVELKQHLQTCAECRGLSGALNHVEISLKQKVMAAPAAGFTQRWQARLQEERLRLHRRQTRLTMLMTVSALFTLLSALVIFAWPWLSSLKAVFWAGVYQFYGFYLLLAGIGEFMTSLLLAMTSVIPLVGWVLAFGMVFELGVLWVVSYRLLTNPRRLELQ